MPSVQVVIPCYNEAERFDAGAFAQCLDAQPGTSFVLVNDGSTDDTGSQLTGFEARYPERVKVVDLAINQGKAEAVRHGLLAAIDQDPDFVGYWDADLATPLAEIERFVATFEKYPATELLLGARVALLGYRIDRSPFRHYAGRIFATVASFVLALPVYDTQCGAKLMRSNERTRGLFVEPFSSGWVFDVEILARYLTLPDAGRRIRELPLERWTDVAGSKVRPQDFVIALRQLFAIHRRYRIRRASLAPETQPPV